MEFPFLFHLSANMGPLCCPKVLARFPNGLEPYPFLLEMILQKIVTEVALFTITMS